MAQQQQAASAVGIDLGTTYSCVSVWRNGAPEILTDEYGSRVQPSYVAFTPVQRLIGEQAVNQVAMNPTNTVFDAKRLIGREFSDPTLKADLEFWPFKVVGDNADRPVIEVEYKGETRQFRPEEISAALLGRLKQVAEHNLGHPVTQAVITVPAYFNDSQRQATKDAGAIAGLEVLRIINEPTAAAIAYGLDQLDKPKAEGEDGSTERTVMVFDLGGGTFDVSLLSMEEGLLEVKATAGDTHLGGEDFDDRMVHHLATLFETRHADVTDGMRHDARAMRRLRTAAERAKRVLSTATEASVQVDALFGGVDLSTTISRAAFEELCSDLLERLMSPVEQVLNDAGIAASAVDDIVLVGGSTRIPKVQEVLSEFFGGKELCRTVNPDEVVAMGAAVQAALLAPESETGETVIEDERIKDLVLLDVTPLSLGLQTAGGVMQVMIPRNTTIPTRAERMFSTAVDNQGEVLIQVFEGERAKTSENHKLGVFEMAGISPAPARTPKISVTFEIDVNGILSVWADNSGQRERITIDADKGLLSEDQIEEMVASAERFHEEDQEYLCKMNARNTFEMYAYSMKSKVAKSNSGIDDSQKELLMNGITEALSWLEVHHEAQLEEVTAKHQELQSLLHPVSPTA
mmetsp:Transcript_13680/g.38744  ORF Transcript_13680/g.38744 Transcript_13680/m.38744 type:complete len:632 (+) Transcript_13680:119-2014(+)|eukprot:CAMPEP_0117666778 /NCGR_PEP_ID=MMETSP0804-20121206/10571_1 /TAXON_ID=1074897 /ORGANISM="Tetraselmis astigmatica, Strain CCMP880" /LENGTH=631 /DNA_ID=CAMNT_0005474373 /DNA_START=76 /DNA_END=1971 /DNA_ORIENTATION=-